MFAFGCLGSRSLTNFHEGVNFANVDGPGQRNEKYELGNLLMLAGFEEIVIQSDFLKLKYSKGATALNELKNFFYFVFDGVPLVYRSDFKKMVQIYFEQCEKEKGLIVLDVELITGHAWKPNKSRKNHDKKIEQIVNFRN